MSVLPIYVFREVILGDEKTWELFLETPQIDVHSCIIIPSFLLKSFGPEILEPYFSLMYIPLISPYFFLA